MHRIFRSSLQIALVLMVVALGACHKAAEPYPARRAAPGTAQLPPRPDLQPPKAPARYPDGAWSVSGLVAADPSTLTGELSVRGTIAAMQVCPLTEKICSPAPYAHLTDARNGQGKRLLVGGERDLAARNWKIGDEVTVSGAFATSSADGIYFAPKGMVLLSPLPVGDAASAAPAPAAR